MSLPPPIIPQTPEQAIQRDQVAGLTPVPLDDPRAELARLRQAIREHHEAVQSAGHLRVMAEDEEHNAPIFEAKHDADLKLWAHIGEST